MNSVLSQIPRTKWCFGPQYPPPNLSLSPHEPATCMEACLEAELKFNYTTISPTQKGPHGVESMRTIGKHTPSCLRRRITTTSWKYWTWTPQKYFVNAPTSQRPRNTMIHFRNFTSCILRLGSPSGYRPTFTRVFLMTCTIAKCSIDGSIVRVRGSCIAWADPVLGRLAAESTSQFTVDQVLDYFCSPDGRAPP